VEDLRRVINGWEVWDLAVGRRVEAMPDDGDAARAAPAVIHGMGQAIDLEHRAGLALRALLRHGRGPASLRGRSLSEALALFPACPRGPIQDCEDRQFALTVRDALPALRELGDDLDTFLADLAYSPKSVIDSPMYRLTAERAGEVAAGRCRSEDESGNSAAEEPARWLTVTQASRLTGCNPGVVSRAVDAGELQGNGKTGRGRRIDAVGLSRWQLARAGKPEPSESTEAVEQKVRKHVRD
jgi:hypothetical protein